MNKKDRDVELDEVEKALREPQRPFIHRPDKLDIGNGTLCWRDGSRLCGADCVAFNVDEGLDENRMPIDTPNKCIVLVYLGQQGSGALSIIDANNLVRKKHQDASRPNPADLPPPPVGGKPR